MYWCYLLLHLFHITADTHNNLQSTNEYKCWKGPIFLLSRQSRQWLLKLKFETARLNNSQCKNTKSICDWNIFRIGNAFVIKFYSIQKHDITHILSTQFLSGFQESNYSHDRKRERKKKSITYDHIPYLIDRTCTLNYPILIIWGIYVMWGWYKQQLSRND